MVLGAAAAKTSSSPVVVPHLRTTRLLLREYQMRDFEAYAAHRADPTAMAILGTLDRRSAWQLFVLDAGVWLLQGIGWWTVELCGSGAVVGSVGAFFRDGILDLELGWQTFRASWGRGYATEAATEVVRYAFEERGERRLTALVDARNTASVRVATRLGMSLVEETVVLGGPVGRYAVEAPAVLRLPPPRDLDERRV